MRVARFLVFILFGLGLGCLAAIYYIGNDAQFKHKIERVVFEDMGKELKCSFKGSVESCNLIVGSCTFKDVVAADPHAQWKWSAQKIVVSWSWLTFLIKRVFGMHVSAYSVDVFSTIANKKLSMATHFERWGALPAGPIKTALKELSFSPVNGTIATPDGSMVLQCRGKGHVNMINHGASVALAVDDGILSLAHQPAFASLNGMINIAAHDKVSGDFQISGGCTFAQIMKKCLIAGTWKEHDFSAHLTSENRLLDLTMGMNQELLTLSGSMPCADFLKIIHVPHLDHAGTCMFNVQTSSDKPFDAYSGTVELRDWFYKKHLLPAYVGQFEYHDKVMHGKGVLEWYGIKSAATFIWNNAQETFSTRLTFAEPFTFERFGVTTDCAKSWVEFGMDLKQVAGKGSGKIVVTLPEKKEAVLNLTCATTRDKAELNLGLNDHKLTMIWLDDKEWYCASVDYYRNGKYRGMVRQKPDGTFKGQCALAAVAKVLSTFTGSKIFGTGILAFDGNQTDSVLKLHSHYDDGEFRIQNLYNGIQSCTFDMAYQFDTRTVQLDNVIAHLNKGTIKIDHAHAHLNPTYGLDWYYIPLLFNDCFLHWKKEASAHATGYVTLSLKQDIANVSGYLLMDGGQVQSNIFSASPEQFLTIGMIKPFVSSEKQTTIAISIKTATPIKIATSILTADASLDLSFKGTVASPRIQGSVQINSGTIHLPYQPLYITEGSLYFLPHQFDKPMIHLIAKNKIQKYAVIMQVSGTLDKPKISFDSSPSLSEQQILSLLLSGSDDGMLNIAVPFNISQTLETLLFGTPESSSKAQRSLGGFLDSLKNIRVIPRLGEKRGSLTLELSDNLRATIQKDLTNAADESRVEVEYGIGDDMVVRAIKDEHGEVGAEFEKSWKFS